MNKLRAAIYKETLLLLRDPGALAVLFVMPVALVITVTLIQAGAFEEQGRQAVPVVVVDKDKGAVSERVREHLSGDASMALTVMESETEAAHAAEKGTYKLAVVVPEGLSDALEQQVGEKVSRIRGRLGIPKPNKEKPPEPARKEVLLYFDAAVPEPFRSSVKNEIDRLITDISTREIYSAFEGRVLGGLTELILDDDYVAFREIVLTRNGREYTPNVVQHNVPAWALFAIFFIVVPLSVNMVKEKNQGTFVRLRTQPISYGTILGGKAVVYLAICLLQFSLILMMGIWLFPLLGLFSIDVSGRLFSLYAVALFSGLAAIGLGLLFGTIARTQEQSAPFGATSVIILAAVSGVWIPVFAMPGFMQGLAGLSPMNWGLEAFYHVFLRNSPLLELLPYLGLLFLFFVATTGISIWYNERKIVDL